MKNRREKMIFLFLVALVLLGVIVWLIMSVVVTPTVDLNDYVVVKMKGSDGEGRIAGLYLDCEALAEKYAKRAKNGYYYKEKNTYYFFVLPDDVPEWTGSACYGVGEAENDEEAAEKLFRSCSPKLSAENDTVGHEMDVLGKIKRTDWRNGESIEIVWSEANDAKSRIERLEAIFGINIVYEDFSYAINDLK